MAVQELKTEQPYFEDVLLDLKPFEIRKNDRNFLIGDVLVLREWMEDHYTGRVIIKVVSYICDYAQQDGYVVMALKEPSRGALAELWNYKRKDIA